jgi:hypothetical protein
MLPSPERECLLNETITSLTSGYCLAIGSGSTANWVGSIVWQCDNGPEQTWKGSPKATRMNSSTPTAGSASPPSAAVKRMMARGSSSERVFRRPTVSGSEDQAVLNARLGLAVDRDLRTALREIERGLRNEGFQPVPALFTLKTPEMPIVLSVLGTTFVGGGGGLPKFLLDTGAIVACFVSSTSRARAARGELRCSPGGYLLGLREELNPHGLIDRIHRAARRPS